MKLRSIREEYWLDACDNATIMIEKVTPATVIIELAIDDNIPREPSAPAPNRRGKSTSRVPLRRESISTSTAAQIADAITMSVGRNHKLDRSAIHNVFSRNMP
jgi:hypothetical protein